MWAAVVLGRHQRQAEGSVAVSYGGRIQELKNKTSEGSILSPKGTHIGMRLLMG
jgi:hypothetical protein